MIKKKKTFSDKLKVFFNVDIQTNQYIQKIHDI